MSDVNKMDIGVQRGRIQGFILGIGRYKPGAKAFDVERWQELQGEPVVYNGFPVYPTKQAAREDRNKATITRWEESTETEYLKQDAGLPSDRDGILVFADGTVVHTFSERPAMFELDRTELELIESWDATLLEVIREAQADS